MRLTKRTIDALVPSPADHFEWDSELRGFGVRVKPSGVKSYIVQYRNSRGRSRRLTLGRFGTLTPEEARQLAIMRLADVQYGEDPAADRRATRNAPIMNELCERYLIEHAEPHKKPSSIRQDRRMISKYVQPILGSLPVESVTRADVLKFQHALRNSRYEANRALSLLCKMFNLAEAWGLRPDGSNPTRHVKRYPEKKRDSFLGREQIARLGKALTELERSNEVHPMPAAALRLLLMTGCRASEVLSFEWAQIDWESGTIRLADSKTGAKTVHLGVAALDILAALPHSGLYVITSVFEPKLPLSIHTLEKAWRRVRTHTQLEGFRIHDLRHTFASWAVMSGKSLPTTGALLGHTHFVTTQRYAHLANDHIHQAANDVTSTLAEMLIG